MKIVYISTAFWDEVKFGGSLSHLIGFTDGLIELGHEVHFIANNPPKGLNDAIKIYRVRPSSLRRFSKILATLRLNYLFVKQAKPVIKNIAPDIIYQRYRLFDYSGVRLSLKLGIPLFLEFNSSEVWTSKHWGKLRLAKIAASIERRNLEKAAKISVVSEILKNDLVKEGVNPAKILVNPNGVDINSFHPDIDGSAVIEKYNLGEKTVAGFIGTFGVWHGALSLVKAIKPCIEKNDNLRFLMMGAGKDLPEAKRLAAASGVEDYVTFTGMVEPTQVPRHLAACDILISPHILLDGTKEFFGSPTKLFEYMAVGKGIVASDLGQIGDILKGGKNSLLVEPGNVEDLTAGILTLANDKALREQLGKAARRDAEDGFTWKANAGRVIEFYK